MKEILVNQLRALTKLTKEELESIIEVPKEKERGDYAFPCFALSKIWKKNPVDIARELASKIKSPEFDKIQAVGPYINFFVNQKKSASKLLSLINKQGEKYGSNNIGKNKKFMVEFSQPNTHKAFHVGHIRGTSLGESLARLREHVGYRVIRANYSGDTGKHIARWIWAYNKFHKNEKIKDDEEWYAKIYVESMQKLENNLHGESEVEEINRKLDSRNDIELMKLWKETRKKSIDSWKPIYEDLDVKFDVSFFESEVEEDGKKIAHELLNKNIAKRSEDAIIMDFTNDNLGVWVLLRKDGTVLYSAKDLALAEIKFKKYKFDESLVITSVEQNLHFQQLRKTLELMKFPEWKNYNHKGFESVRFPWGKMSSRTGDNVLYADFRNELVKEAKHELQKRDKLSQKELEKRALVIGVAAMKYTMLKQDINKIIIFNKEEALRFEGDSGPYLLYSYARAKSILRKAGKNKASYKIDKINNSERLLLNALSDFPDVVQQASGSLEPSALAHYAYSLAKEFNEFYHANKVIGTEEEEFRLSLVKSFAQVLKNALNLLGIDVLEEM